METSPSRWASLEFFRRFTLQRHLPVGARRKCQEQQVTSHLPVSGRSAEQREIITDVDVEVAAGRRPLPHRPHHRPPLPKVGGIAEFCASAQARSAIWHPLDQVKSDNLKYGTPWFDLTGCTKTDLTGPTSSPASTFPIWRRKWPPLPLRQGQSPLLIAAHLGKFYEKLQADIDAL